MWTHIFNHTPHFIILTQSSIFSLFPSLFPIPNSLILTFSSSSTSHLIYSHFLPVVLLISLIFSILLLLILTIFVICFGCGVRIFSFSHRHKLLSTNHKLVLFGLILSTSIDPIQKIIHPHLHYLDDWLFFYIVLHHVTRISLLLDDPFFQVDDPYVDLSMACSYNYCCDFTNSWNSHVLHIHLHPSQPSQIPHQHLSHSASAHTQAYYNSPIFAFHLPQKNRPSSSYFSSFKFAKYTSSTFVFQSSIKFISTAYLNLTPSSQQCHLEYVEIIRKGKNQLNSCPADIFMLFLTLYRIIRLLLLDCVDYLMVVMLGWIFFITFA